MESFGEESSSGQRYYNTSNNNNEATATILAFNVSRNANKKKRQGKKRYLAEERHKNNANLDMSQNSKKIAKWRMRERMKTVCVSLVYCLNIGVDPPDVIKTEPCARMECWIDPLSQPQQKALENIGKALQSQYERWQPRARYKTCLDPTVDEVKKLCLSTRRNAKDERVLFHYNGHGVPRPTNNGEIWVFNKNYTQYIPLSIYELQTWMASPSIYVFDCSAAGMIVNWFLQFAEQREKEYERLAAASNSNTPSVVPVKDFILLAACGANELLPMNPDLPADVFTACLTTPIKMAVRWFASNSLLVKPGITLDLIDQIPGRLTDRRTPLGELNWIFTAVTDTIAWNLLPRDLFQKLFRQDLLVASLFRNFLLAERIMRPLNCTPLSYPKLPIGTHQHPMWQSWDLAVDMCLSQLPEIIDDPTVEYKFSPFFTDQLTAFEVWLEFGSETKKPPEQLPIVLQVLLSQTHRLRALYLLGRFLDLGPWAVNLALSVGIFPYVLKLLQSPAIELCQILVFIWAKILALDKSCQLDLVKDNGHNYFINVLSSSGAIDSEQRTMAAFILSVIANNCRPGQSACLTGNLLQICLAQLNEPDPLLRRWVILCMAKLWESFEDAKWAAVRETAPEKLCALLSDPVPEVRAAAVYALGTFIGGAEGNDQRTNIEMNLGLTLMIVTGDVSAIVRKELIVSLSRLVRCYERKFKDAAAEVLSEEKNASRKLKATKSKEEIPTVASNNNTNPDTSGSIYAVLWKIMLTLATDPFPELAKMAEGVVRSIVDQVNPPQPVTPMSPTASRRNVVKTPTKPKFASLNFGTKLKDSGSAPPSPMHTKKAPSMDLPKMEDEEPAPPLPTEDLQSIFYEWSCEYFSKPLLNAKDIDDETSPYWSQRRWKQQRIDSTLASAKAIHSDYNNVSVMHRFDEQVAILDNSPDSTSSLLLHSFEPLIAIADDKDGISIWDRELCQKVHNFKNKSVMDAPVVSHTTGMCFLNEHDSTLLLVGSDDGIVRVWANNDEPSKHYLVTSWRALSGLTPGNRGTGLVLNWQQDFGLLLTSGDVGVIRLWDMERETLLQDVSSGSDHSVTCLASAAPFSRCFIAGYSDGSIRLFDQRVPSKYSNVSSFVDHKDWIVNAHIPKMDTNRIVSGSITGEVKLWDIRDSSRPTKGTVAHSKGVMTALTVHDYAPLFATGSQAQKVKVFNFNLDELSLIRYHDGFLGQRIGPISCLSFHPYLMLLVAGATDSIVSLYTKR